MSDISLLGGIPLKGQDLAASIVFAVAYCVLAGVCVWRLVSPATRCGLLVRPAIFIVARIGTFIIRAVMADGHNDSTGLYIAEQILLLCGFVLLCDPLMQLAAYHISRHAAPSAQRGGHSPKIMVLLRLCLLTALILGIYAGSKMGSVIGSGADSGSTLSTLKTCRDVNAILCLVVTVSVGLTVAFWQVSGHGLPVRPALVIITGAVLLSVCSGYRIFIYEKSPAVSAISVSTKSGFYCLSALPEFLVTAIYVGFNVVELCDVREGVAKEKESKAMRKAHMQGGAYHPEPAEASNDKYPPTYGGARHA